MELPDACGSVVNHSQYRSIPAPIREILLLAKPMQFVAAKEARAPTVLRYRLDQLQGQPGLSESSLAD